MSYILTSCILHCAPECAATANGAPFAAPFLPLFLYPLTYSMVQSPSWEASQEIPRISRNPKVQYRTHKRPPPLSILGQPNPVHIPTSHLLEIHPNIIHPSTPRSPQWSPSFRFPHQDPIHPPLLTNTRHIPSPYQVPVLLYIRHRFGKNLTKLLPPKKILLLA